eukprot:UN08262
MMSRTSDNYLGAIMEITLTITRLKKRKREKE